MDLRRLLTRTADTYGRDGWQGVGYGALRKLLWSPREWTRERRWRRESANGDLERQVLGLRMRLNPADKGLSAELAVEGSHEPLLTRLLGVVLSPGDVVVDVGSNIGYFALVEARHVGRAGKVLAYEPFPGSFNLLRENIQLNRFENVEARPHAIGAAIGRVPMFVFHEANWNSLIAREAGHTSTIQVDVTTLDRELATETRVDLVRMDVEGYECEVVSGMTATLRQRQPLLVVEVHAFSPPERLESFFSTLQASGYEVALAFPRMREEQFFGRILARPDRVYEQTSIRELRVDARLVRLKENFSVLFAPAAKVPNIRNLALP